MDKEKQQRLFEAEALHRIEGNPLTQSDVDLIEQAEAEGLSDTDFTARVLAYAAGQSTDDLAAE